MYTKLTLALLLLALFSSCKKKGKDYGKVLLSKKWHLISNYVTPARLAPDSVTYFNEQFPYMNDCHKDDYIVFDPNGFIYMNSGEIECNPGVIKDKYFKVGRWFWSYDKEDLSVQEFLYFSYPDQYQIAPMHGNS